MRINANEGEPYFFHRIVIKRRKDFHLHFSLADLEKKFPGISINKLFTSLPPERITELVSKAATLNPEYQIQDFLSYYAIDCPPEVIPTELLQTVLRNEDVELAYIENDLVVPPSVSISDNPLSSYQGYLNSAPIGINARYGWNFKGGDGKGNVRFIDIEQGWISNHEDIIVTPFPLAGINHPAFQDHGAAVLGVIMMQDNRIGGIGITPKTNGSVISQWRPDGSLNNADAIMTALHYLGCGDIVLLEAQTFDSALSNKAWPVEIQEAPYQVIRLATALGIIVIESAGNGDLDSRTGNDLDGFRLNGKTILNRNSSDLRDSGAIIVGAASADMPHQKLYYSNYGSRIDCYAWGEKVVTAGYYPKYSGLAINTYTGKFSGTSSAAAIIAGVAIAVQSISGANYNVRLSPAQMRDILSSELYGTASANGRTKDKIGVMPDLKKITDKKLKCKRSKNFYEKSSKVF